jgi:hypothetical protein
MYSTVFLCDCAKLSPQPPSTPHFFRITVPRPWTAATLLRLFTDNRIGTSSHGIQLAQVLELAEIQGKFPGSEAVIYAIPGCQFSPMAVPTAATIHATTAAALQILTDLGCNPGSSIGTTHPELGPALLR